MSLRYRDSIAINRLPDLHLIPQAISDRASLRPLSRCLGMTRLWACLFLGSVASTLGCSSETADRLPVFPVEGTVLRGSTPLANALVTLHPQSESPQSLAARGWTDEAGKFRLTTYDANDGAAEGSYTVTVTAYSTIDDGGSKVPGPNTLPQKYATPQTSGIVVTVSNGPTTLEPIQLP